MTFNLQHYKLEVDYILVELMMYIEWALTEYDEFSVILTLFTCLKYTKCSIGLRLYTAYRGSFQM